MLAISTVALLMVSNSPIEALIDPGEPSLRHWVAQEDQEDKEDEERRGPRVPRIGNRKLLGPDGLREIQRRRREDGGNPRAVQRQQGELPGRRSTSAGAASRGNTSAQRPAPVNASDPRGEAAAAPRAGATRVSQAGDSDDIDFEKRARSG
ncbi:MAG: hypothetical protein AAF658_04905, partial [Myxococcota bacterium]